MSAITVPNMAEKPIHPYQEKGLDNEGVLNYISFNMHPDNSGYSFEEYKLGYFYKRKASISTNLLTDRSSVPHVAQGRPLDLLRGPSTCISVGSTDEAREANMWSLPVALILRHSPYLKTMSSSSGLFPKSHINLPNDDAVAFGLFVEWLYYGTYDDFQLPSSSNIHARCWILGDKLLCNEFKNHAMGRLYKQHMEFSMTCQDVEFVFANTSATSKLRQFYMDFIKQNFSNPKKLRGPVGNWDAILQKDADLRISLLLCIRQDSSSFAHLEYLKDYLDFDEVFFTGIAPPAVESIQLSVRQKKRNKKKTSMANIRSKENAESPELSAGAQSRKPESLAGNECEPVKAPVSGDDTKPVYSNPEKTTAPVQAVERKEYTEGSVESERLKT
ncbi:sdr family [Fusarium pseudocircinatum]|uniref:Sdr family n=1 Tax=Fusarium pseudocircinatum TaxID=56676 RepID=A0A8H5NZP2_9HYPO|nr:sdr family [Fusarium pseudocircinatum]